MPPDDELGLGSETEDKDATLSLGDSEDKNLDKDKENLDDDDDLDDGTNDQGIAPEIYSKLNHFEREQVTKGWRPKGEHDKSDEDHLSARQYKFNGDLISKIDKLTNEAKENNASMDDRLKNATMFINMQNNQLRQQLEEAKTEAIKEGKVEEVKKIDDKLKNIPEEEREDEEKERKQSSDQALLLDWKSENAWVFDESSEKYKFADNHFKVAFNSKKMSMSDALEYVDKKVSEKYPDKSGDVNERRNEAGLGEGGGKGGGKKGTGLVPKTQWSDEEKSVAASLEGDFTEKEIIQMVTDSRRAS